MNFIKKIFENKIDESAHNQFIRFSKGIFDKRAAINFRTNGKIKLSTSFELANDMVELFADLVPKFKVSGMLLTREDPKNFGLTGKNKKGVFEIMLDKEISSQEIKKMAEKAYLMLLDCSAAELELKIKKKLPKPGKSAGAKVNDTFCILDAGKKFEKQIMQDFLFDIPQCKKCKIYHKYEITEVIVTTGDKDFEEMRRKAKKKGKITRVINSDGKEQTKERDFVA